MEKIRKLFFEIEMTWLKVILFAVISAVVTAFLLICPLTADTSFGNLGVSFEGWVLFAIIIALNCEKPVEAGLKVFVFFLISQPLIYLIQVPFSSFGWQIFMYYPTWGIWTLLCLPGGMIAWLVKKDNLLSGVILAVATGFLAYIGIDYLHQCTMVFPKNLITVIFCLVLAFGLIFVLLKNKRARLIALILTILTVGVAVYFFFFSTPYSPNTTMFYLDASHSWTITETEGNIGEVTLDEKESCVKIKSDKAGTETITFTNELGEEYKLIVQYDDENGFMIEPVMDEEATN